MARSPAANDRAAGRCEDSLPERRETAPCRDDQPMRDARAFGRLQLGLHIRKGPPPGGPFKEVPVARLEAAVRGREVEEVEQVIQCRGVYRRIRALELHRVRE